MANIATVGMAPTYDSLMSDITLIRLDQQSLLVRLGVIDHNILMQDRENEDVANLVETRIGAADWRVYEENVAAFRRNFARYVSSFIGIEYLIPEELYPAETLHGLAEVRTVGSSFDLLRIFERDRRLRYYRDGNANCYEELPLMTPHPLWSPYTWECRLIMGSKVLWLEQRMQEGRGPYQIEPRYGQDHDTDLSSLMQSLPNERQWIVHPGFLLPTELHAILLYHEISSRILRKLATIVKRLKRLGSDRPVDVDTVSVDCTASAMQSEELTCSICLQAYGWNQSPEGDRFDEARRLKTCGHVLGRDCLARWLGQGSNTCPLCRQPMCTMRDMLPAAVQTDYDEYVRLSEQHEQLDSRVDAFFLHEPRSTYGVDYNEVLPMLQDVEGRARALRSPLTEYWRAHRQERL